jgi:hypothetical protein
VHSNLQARKMNESFGWTSYHTLEEIYKWLGKMAHQLPATTQVVVGGRKYKGREIRGIKILFKISRQSCYSIGKWNSCQRMGIYR